MEALGGTVAMENPFTFKAGQVFYRLWSWMWDWNRSWLATKFRKASENRRESNGAIPVLNRVMSATRGATDAVSGIGAHVNSSLRRLGMKTIEAGIGCGVGHGFGVGVPLKAGVMNQIQSCIGQTMVKIMKNLGGIPGFSIDQNLIPKSTQSGLKFIDETLKRSEISSGDIRQIASRVSESRSHSLVGERKVLPETSFGSRCEKVINNFLSSPLLQDEKEMEVNALASKLQVENNVLQVLLKHQRIIEELIEENEKLRQVLIKELKVSPEKLKTSSDSRFNLDTTCVDCFECQRRRRKSSR